MKNVAIFEKVSFEEFQKSVLKIYKNCFAEEISDKELRYYYDKIKLPKRGTRGSAGYDFFYPLWDKSIASNTSIKIPTGIKVKILKEDWFLGLFTKSGLSHSYKTRLMDTVSIIDQDYYNIEKNEGHIGVELVNDSNMVLKLKNGDPYCQGIFIEYGTTVGDDVTTVRIGGYGSTSET